MNYRYSRLLAVLVISMLVAFPTFAQTTTTGAIEGRVTEASGTLPGVTVEVTSPAMAGSRIAVTDAGGRFRMPLLPPGEYSLSATLPGFQTVRQSNIRVGLGRTASIDIRMSSAAIAQEITVTAEAPVVDVTSTKTGANVTAETIASIPLGRDFYAVAQVAPGTNEDAVGTTFYGGTGAENQYIIDGLNTTGAEYGTEGKQLNMDFIQEVEVLTGGLPAEYGRITGGVINAITKSGGNEFQGSVFGNHSSGGDNDTADERPVTTTSITELDEQFDYGFDAGGYLMRDRLWFFAAVNQTEQTEVAEVIRNFTDPASGLPIVGTPTIGTVIPTDVERLLYAGKLTFQINPNQTLALSAFGDPTDTTGVLFPIAGEPTTYFGTIDAGGVDAILRYSGIFGGSWVVNANVGRHEEDSVFGGAGTQIPLLLDQSLSPNVRTGGFSFFSNDAFERTVYKGDVSKFIGGHDLKVGADFEELKARSERTYGGGQLIYKLRNRGPDGVNFTPDDIIYFRHRFFVDENDPGLDRDDATTWRPALPFLVAEPQTKNTSFYVQDSWRVLPNFTVNAGVRLETQEILGREDVTNIDIDDNWSPRLGFIWDVLNNGRSKLFANYGRFYESVPMDINIRSFGGESIAFLYNFSPDPNNLTPEPTPSRTSLLGGATTPVDPDLKGQYIDELLVGYEYEASPGLALGIKATYRDLGRVIEDFLIIEEGGYFIANPGEGIGDQMTFYDYEPVAAPKAKREYTAFELSARKRFSNNYQFFASYVWSKLEGNYDGLFQASTGQLDPNINSAFDYADFLINAEGDLTNDREHQLKFYGSYTFGPGGLTVGAAAHYGSGRPLTAMGYSFAYANWEYYLTPRGSLGTGPDEYEMDLHLGYPIALGNEMRLNLVLDVFNLLDRQAASFVDIRYNLPEHGHCGGIPEEHCNTDNGLLHQPGSLDPVSQLVNPRATAPNPDFLTAGTVFTPPRSIRLGVKLSF
jgi:outer membrane receptor protein involved in Fe transport